MSQPNRINNSEFYSRDNQSHLDSNQGTTFPLNSTAFFDENLNPVLPSDMSVILPTSSDLKSSQPSFYIYPEGYNSNDDSEIDIKYLHPGSRPISISSSSTSAFSEDSYNSTGGSFPWNNHYPQSVEPSFYIYPEGYNSNDDSEIDIKYLHPGSRPISISSSSTSAFSEDSYNSTDGAFPWNNHYSQQGSVDPSFFVYPEGYNSNDTSSEIDIQYLHPGNRPVSISSSSTSAFSEDSYNSAVGAFPWDDYHLQSVEPSFVVYSEGYSSNDTSSEIDIHYLNPGNRPVSISSSSTSAFSEDSYNSTGGSFPWNNHYSQQGSVDPSFFVYPEGYNSNDTSSEIDIQYLHPGNRPVSISSSSTSAFSEDSYNSAVGAFPWDDYHLQSVEPSFVVYSEGYSSNDTSSEIDIHYLNPGNRPVSISSSSTSAFSEDSYNSAVGAFVHDWLSENTQGDSMSSSDYYSDCDEPRAPNFPDKTISFEFTYTPEITFFAKYRENTRVLGKDYVTNVLDQYGKYMFTIREYWKTSSNKPNKLTLADCLENIKNFNSLEELLDYQKMPKNVCFSEPLFAPRIYLTNQEDKDNAIDITPYEASDYHNIVSPVYQSSTVLNTEIFPNILDYYNDCSIYYNPILLVSHCLM